MRHTLRAAQGRALTAAPPPFAGKKPRVPLWKTTAFSAGTPCSSTAFETVETAQGAFVARDILQYETLSGISARDVTSDLADFLRRAGDAAGGAIDGTLTATSRHTTVAVAINEAEERLIEDLRLWLGRLAPPAGPYLHNDLDRRELPGGWQGTREAWVAQEPLNAHAHLAAMLLGASVPLPVTQGGLALGRWQSALLVDLDGPRTRSLALTFHGVVTTARGEEARAR